MKIFATSLLLLTAAVSPVLRADDLPLLNEKPWLGCYAGYERRNFHFSVSGDGVGLLVPMADRKVLMSSRSGIRIQPVVEEVAADGKVTSRNPKKGGWEAITPASGTAEKVVYRGTTTGDAKFEVTFEFSGDEIRYGGRLLENGSLKQPRFVLRVQVPDVYSTQRNIEKRQELAKRDKVELVRTDGKKLKLDVLTPMDAESAEFNGPGVTEARIDLNGYKGHKFEILSGASAAFEFWNRGEDGLIEGFTLGWKPDPAKDPEGKARGILRAR